MPNSYDLGDSVQIDCVITDANGELTDPTSVVCIIERPDGVQLGYYLNSGLTSQGNWDASTNNPALANGAGTAGHYYTCNVAGSVDFGDGSITFAVGDWVFYNGKAWRRLPNPQSTNVMKISTGNYRVAQYVGVAKTWIRRWEAIGAIGADEDQFYVRPSSI